MKKKILKSSIVLILFSLSILIFNLSCEEPVLAQQQNYVLPSATSSTLGGIKVGGGLTITTDGILSVVEDKNTHIYEPHNRFLYVFYNDIIAETEFWTAKLDGSDMKKIPISLPSGLKISSQSGVLTPDGQTLIFTVMNESDLKYIYSISTSGGDLKKLIDGTSTTGFAIIYDVLQTY